MAGFSSRGWMLFGLLIAALPLAACGSSPETRTSDNRTGPDPSWSDAPAALTALCRKAASTSEAPVRCPRRLPGGGASSSFLIVRERDLAPGPCGYLLEANYRRPRSDNPFHVVFGGRCGVWPLESAHGRWPRASSLKNDLRVIGTKPLEPGQFQSQARIARAKVLGGIEVSGEPGLVLRMPPYPAGGVHGGHVAAVWNTGGNGYIVSLHFLKGAATSREVDLVTEVARQMAPV